MKLLVFCSGFCFCAECGGLGAVGAETHESLMKPSAYINGTLKL